MEFEILGNKVETPKKVDPALFALVDTQNKIGKMFQTSENGEGSETAEKSIEN